MDLLEVLQSFNKKVDNYTETSNYYYQYHNCSKIGNNIKILLDYTLLYEKTSEIVKFGICEDCRTCFYHRDYKTRSF